MELKSIEKTAISENWKLFCCNNSVESQVLVLTLFETAYRNKIVFHAVLTNETGGVSNSFDPYSAGKKNEINYFRCSDAQGSARMFSVRRPFTPNAEYKKGPSLCDSP